MRDIDRELLEFERRQWRYAGKKEDAIRKELGLSPTAYYQRLNVLSDDPEAIAAYPTLTARLRRLAGKHRPR